MITVALQKAAVLHVQHVIFLTAIVHLVVQIIIVITTNANPVLPVKRHHRAADMWTVASLHAPVTTTNRFLDPTIGLVVIMVICIHAVVIVVAMQEINTPVMAMIVIHVDVVVDLQHQQ